MTDVIHLLGYSCPAHTMEVDQHIGSLYTQLLGRGQLELVRTAFSRSLCTTTTTDWNSSFSFLGPTVHGLGCFLMVKWK